MNTKLYNKNGKIKEITVEEFDAFCGEHRFSEGYQKKKQQIINMMVTQKNSKLKRRTIKAAIAAVAILFCSTTVAALGSSYLKSVYQEWGKEIDDKYMYKGFVDAEYNLPFEVETDSEDELLEFQVLQADKGEHNITYAILVTINVPLQENVAGYDWISRVKLAEMDLKGKMNGNGWKSDMEDSYLNLAENQVIEFCECSFDDSVDLSRIDSFELEFYDICQDILEDVEYIDREHTWTLKIPLNYSYKDYIYDIKDSCQLQGTSVYVHKVYVTPTYIACTVSDMKDIESQEKERFCNLDLWDKAEINLLMSDGKKLSLDKVSHSASDVKEQSEEKVRRFTFSFDVPLDPEQIAGLEIDGQVFELAPR